MGSPPSDADPIRTDEAMTPPRVQGPSRRLGALAFDVEESADLVRDRVAMMLGIILAIAGPLWVVNALLNALFFPAFEPGRVTSPRSMLHGGAVLLLTGLWVVARRHPVLSVARRIEWLSMMTLGLTVAGMVSLSNAAYRPELIMALALGHFLALRAAVVPSTWKATATVGTLVEVPTVVAAWYVHAMDQGGALSPTSAAAASAVWAGMTVAVTSLISFVIYGLHQRVRAVAQLGQYVLEAKVGEGGMGVVYRARHAMLRRPTAVKLLLPERADKRHILRFEREVQLTASLSHPHIVAVHDFGRTRDGVFYYAMEYIDGLDLDSLVRCDGPQPPGRVRHILRQAASALAEAHRVGLIHRDVKPANVMLSEGSIDKDRVKLLDFGLVKDLSDGRSDVTDLGQMQGTPLYIAPEAIKTPQSVDARCDLYSFGALGYFLLTGSPVFEGTSVVEVCARHLHDKPISPSNRLGSPVPPSLEALLLACLNKAPSDRPASAEAIVDALDEAADCPAWSREDARRWWKDRAPAVRSQSELASLGEQRTLAVDFRDRE
jgi:serine/threonine-protein kinase